MHYVALYWNETGFQYWVFPSRENLNRLVPFREKSMGWRCCAILKIKMKEQV